MVVLHQMTLYIEKKISYHYKSGYRKSHSTLTNLIKLRGDMDRAMKSGEVTLGVFVDFSKAFDTICFNILIHKLHSLHFSKNLFLSHFKLFIKQKPFHTNRFTQFRSFVFKIWCSTRVELRSSII